MAIKLNEIREMYEGKRPFPAEGDEEGNSRAILGGLLILNEMLEDVSRILHETAELSGKASGRLK